MHDRVSAKPASGVRNNMEKKNFLLTGLAGLVALVAVAGIAYSSFASTPSTGMNTQTSGNGIGKGMGMHQRQANLTDEEKAKFDAQRAERVKDMEAKRAEITSAMAQGYDAWATAVKKQMGDSAPILEQVNAKNFGKYAEAHGYMEKAHVILEEIGVDRGLGAGKGMGRGMGGPGGCTMSD